jgi:hypothetical protein
MMDFDGLVTVSFSWTPAADFSNRGARIIAGIRCEECSAVEELHSLLGKGVQCYLMRHFVGQKAEARVFDVLLEVLRAIRDDTIREPEQLHGFVRAVVRQTVAAACKPERNALGRMGAQSI